MLKTGSRFRHKDQAISQSVDPHQSDQIGHNNNNKAITSPLALSLLIGLNNNNKCCISDSDFVRSPKSPLEFRMLSTMVAEPFFLRSPRSSLTAHLNCCCGPAKVGLSIVDSLGDDRVLSPDVVFGPALRIKSSEIKDNHPKSLKINEKERSGGIFEIGDNLSETEPIGLRNRTLSRSKLAAERDIVFSGCVSEEEMEMSEDYTCIISHGPNPKTTHIYGDRVLECHKNELKEDDVNKEKHIETEFDSMFPYDNFLSVCNFCNKKLDVGKDIYMYREKGFCSAECRSEEMVIEEEDMEDSCLTMHESLKKLF
uniref:FLZ-type domain-containing protein n=1 Tax=Noccaea caerulescens TaxID=107243 RepID=A0A1J3EZH0_NOCCA